MGKLKPGEKGACLKCEYLSLNYNECLCRANQSKNAVGRSIVSRICIANDIKPYKDVLDRLSDKSYKCIMTEKHIDNYREYIAKVNTAKTRIHQAKYGIYAYLYMLELENRVNPSWCPLRKE